MRHVVWLRRDATVITRVHETDHGYMMIELIDRRTGRVILGPRPAKISPEKLVAYGFKQMAA